MKTISLFFAFLLIGVNGFAQNSSSDENYFQQSETFEVTTWNIEFFGREDRGPSDIQKQYVNVLQVIDSLGSDLIGLQEIWNLDLFVQLVEELEDYKGIVANYPSRMKIAFLYNMNTIEYLGRKLIDEQYGVIGSDFNNRPPLEIMFNLKKSDSVTDTMYAVTIHAMHGTDLDAYDLRLNGSTKLKKYFDDHRKSKPLIFLGDYNDDVIYSESRDYYPPPFTPYHNFVEDEFYQVVTKPISESGRRLIDHITINDHLSDSWIKDSEEVHDPHYIDDFKNTTSDHYPVTVRFKPDNLTTNIEQNSIPNNFKIIGNYPNPFNPSTNIVYSNTTFNNVSLEVYNMLGQKVQKVDLGLQPSGRHEFNFSAANLSSGLYLVRMRSGNEIQKHFITLLK